MDQDTSKSFDLTHTPDLCGWVERSDIEIVKVNVFSLN